MLLLTLAYSYMQVLTTTYASTNNNMSVLKQVNKGPHMNSMEQFYIQLYAHNKKLLPEQNPAEYNPIFSFVYNLHSHLSTA
jgi:hypothetical protein